jgi:uncharacterized protein (DUF1697 family)
MVHTALLLGINVGSRNQVAMFDLRSLFTRLGFPGTQSLLQSGSLIFESGRRTGAELERLFEVETEKHLKVRADYLVRTSAEWKEIVARNPFPGEAKDNPSHLVVMFLKKAPKPKDVEALRAAIRGPEMVRAEGGQDYLFYPAGIGRSKLTTTLIESKLGCRGTGRNWNTVLNCWPALKPERHARSCPSTPAIAVDASAVPHLHRLVRAAAQKARTRGPTESSASCCRT